MRLKHICTNCSNKHALTSIAHVGYADYGELILGTLLRLPGAHVGVVLIQRAVAALCDGRQDLALVGTHRLAIGNGQRDIPALADYVDALIHPLGKLL